MLAALGPDLLSLRSVGILPLIPSAAEGHLL